MRLDDKDRSGIILITIAVLVLIIVAALSIFTVIDTVALFAAEFLALLCFAELYFVFTD